MYSVVSSGISSDPFPESLARCVITLSPTLRFVKLMFPARLFVGCHATLCVDNLEAAFLSVSKNISYCP